MNRRCTATEAIVRPRAERGRLPITSYRFFSGKGAAGNKDVEIDDRSGDMYENKG